MKVGYDIKVETVSYLKYSYYSQGSWITFRVGLKTVRVYKN